MPHANAVKIGENLEWKFWVLYWYCGIMGKSFMENLLLFKKSVLKKKIKSISFCILQLYIITAIIEPIT